MNGQTVLNPFEHPAVCQQYFSDALGIEVEIVRAEELAGSSRQSPWRFDLRVGGEEKSYVLRLDEDSSAQEFNILKALENLPILVPRVYGLDESGDVFGVPCFFMDYIDGESLLEPMLAGEEWAEELFIQSALHLQNIPDEMLKGLRKLTERQTAEDVLDAAYEKLSELEDPVAEDVYKRLKTSVPILPRVRFSNGDLYPDNFRVRDKKLVAVIDFANASFSDPLFEFLLPFFCHPELRGRGIEERYCEQRRIDPAVLPWYHLLEFYDLWGWLAGSEESFAGYNAKKLQQILSYWLENDELP